MESIHPRSCFFWHERGLFKCKIVFNYISYERLANWAAHQNIHRHELEVQSWNQSSHCQHHLCRCNDWSARLSSSLLRTSQEWRQWSVDFSSEFGKLWNTWSRWRGKIASGISLLLRRMEFIISNGLIFANKPLSGTSSVFRIECLILNNAFWIRIIKRRLNHIATSFCPKMLATHHLRTRFRKRYIPLSPSATSFLHSATSLENGNPASQELTMS